MEAPWTTARPHSWSEAQEKLPTSVTDGVDARQPVGCMGPANSSRPNPIWHVSSSRILYGSAAEHLATKVGSQ